MGQLRIDRLPGFEHGMPPIFGAVAFGLGILFLLLGWRLHRVTVAVFGFLVGAMVGQLIARWIQVDRGWGLAIGGLSFALLADPLHRVVVFLLAGLALGSVAGEGVRWLNSASFLWGFAPGFLVGGLLSLWKLRLLVILSTSLLGSLALFWGGAVFLGAWIYPPAARFHVVHPMASLVMIALVFLIGAVVQFRIAPKRAAESERKADE